ncbi:antibiotic acetyltransferase [Bacteroidetes/Chlorobi group bacterium ChocPot_Mid]|nr:MAG: antibiotic acetyltransferase [Bacteroidetes/Chlorobi group bacterium ChocPot_Mid]
MKIKKLIKIIDIIFSALRNPSMFGYLVSYRINTEMDKSVKLNTPYHISNCKIGKYSYIAPYSNISETSIGKFCSIGPNFFCGWGIHPTNGLSTSPMFYSTLKQNGFTLSKVDKIQERKKISIGNDVFIGANVTVLDGVTIGDGAIIGAGAVVSKDIPPYAIAVGVPIKVTRYRFNDEQISKLLKIKWWDFSDENLKDVEILFFDIDKFIEKYE